MYNHYVGMFQLVIFVSNMYLSLTDLYIFFPLFHISPPLFILILSSVRLTIHAYFLNFLFTCVCMNRDNLMCFSLKFHATVHCSMI